MTQEEKAKAYDAALERIFLELKENDYKKIKNAILNHLKKMWVNCQDDIYMTYPLRML